MINWKPAVRHVQWRFLPNGAPHMGMMLPFAGLVLVALVSGIIVLSSLVAKMDENADVYKRSVVSGALNREVQSIADAAYSTARWDDAVGNLYGSINRSWAETNLSYPIDCYVIDGRGQTLWAMGGDGKAVEPLTRASPADIQALLHKLPRDLAGAKRMTTGVGLIASNHGKPTFVGAMPIIPLQGTRQIAGPNLRYLVFVRKLDATVLQKWKDAFHFREIDWAIVGPEERINALTVMDSSGAYLGSITWPIHRSGEKAIQSIMPILAVCGIVFATLSLWLILLIHRSRTALETNSRFARIAAAEATRNADQAEQARAQAEAALADAEEARRRAAEMAQREVAEQALHQRQLRENSRKIAAALQESMSSLVKQLLETANDLELSAEMTMSTIYEQQKQADAVRDRSRDAAASVQAITAGIGQLTASITEIRRAADESRQSALRASDRSAAARSANDHLLTQVNSISDAASLIASIAKQTNLLALNATIEAARAGESGYGFAVVANEVKALASQTAQTTSSIHDRVGGIEMAARSTVDLVGTVDEILDALVQSMASSSATVQQQQVVAEDIQRNSRGVAETAQAADQAVEAISRSLESVARTATSTQQIGAAVRNRAEHLNAEFARLVAQLEAA